MWPGSQYLDLMHLPCLSVEGAKWWEGWRWGCKAGGEEEGSARGSSFHHFLFLYCPKLLSMILFWKKNLNLPKFFKIKIQAYLSPRKSQISKHFNDIILDLLRSPKVIWSNLLILHMKKLRPKHYLIYTVLEPRLGHRTADFFSHKNFPEDSFNMLPQWMT